jgi:DNA-directed RNA polymerase specialized sigma24 family protein
MTMPLDGRAWLREALAGWPDALRDDAAAFLDTLPYRVRRAVELVYGEGLRVDHAACVMRVSERTLREYLRLAHLQAEHRYC